MGPDFQSMHAMLCLHIWLLLVRLRAEGGAGKELAQVLYDEFQEDVEQRARRAGVKVRPSTHCLPRAPSLSDSAARWACVKAGGTPL